MSQTLADDSEVVFEQPGKSAGAMEQEGLVPSRSKEETWLEDTEDCTSVKHFRAIGPCVTFVVYIYSSRHIVMSVRLSRQLSKMTPHALS